ncbi:hypothetical protein ACA910_008354 [Epithemia clementina (nom. ined.)]
MKSTFTAIRDKNRKGYSLDTPLRIAITSVIVWMGYRVFFSSNSECVTTSTLLREAISGIDTVMSRLSREQSFLPKVDALYEKYGHEIAAYRPTMREWCEKTKSCKFCDLEVEMLYLLIRETKPRRVFEMAPNRGYSTHWILKALYENKIGELHSFDLHDSCVEHMQAPDHEKRWKFTLGDYQDLLKSGELVMKDYDFIFIDALHTEEFSRGYCRNLLAPYKTTKAIVAIHDIVADRSGGGRESAEVYKYLAFAPNAKNIFTMSKFLMPSYAFPLENGLSEVNRIRAAQRIVKPCPEGDKCDQLHDPLYFDNDSNPTIFFQLN